MHRSAATESCACRRRSKAHQHCFERKPTARHCWAVANGPIPHPFEMDGEADAPGVGEAQASPVGSSYSNVQTRPASLEHAAGPRSLEAAGDASGGRRQLRAMTVADESSHCAATSERADMLGEELTCILEFINAKVVASARESLREVCECAYVRTN